MSGTWVILNRKKASRGTWEVWDEEIMRYQQHINGNWLSLKKD